MYNLPDFICRFYLVNLDNIFKKISLFIYRLINFYFVSL